MATLADLVTLRTKLQAIIGAHGGATGRVTEGQLKGAQAPVVGVTYLTLSEYELCLTKGYLVKYVPPSVGQNGNNLTPTGGPGGPSSD